MYRKVFVDANIILDIFDDKRPDHSYSFAAYAFMLKSKWLLFTSCDIITTVYYVDSKRDRRKAISKIEDINKIINIIDFSNREVAHTCKLMKEDKNYRDMEDTLQYLLAKKEQCDVIISNDRGFVSKQIELLSSQAFIKKYISK
jgi:predicted nucleic acid-binding protein